MRALVIKLRAVEWTPRARLYGGALVITLVFLLMGTLGNANPVWAQMNLPLSSLSVLLMGLAAAEAYLFVLRVQRQSAELETARLREHELSQRLTFHRQTVLNEISRQLIDRLDVNEMPRDVLEKIAQLFEADLIAVWVVDKSDAANVSMKGVFGQSVVGQDQIESLRLSLPPFENKGAGYRQIIVEDSQRQSTGMLPRFCENNHIASCALSPIVCRGELAGGVGIFYHSPLTLSGPLAAEMQTVANIIASAIQAEELYRNLVHVQKIESVGALASGIAHDFNNVLAAILACANYIKQQTDPATPSFRYLEATESSAHRGAALTKQLLSFVRREGPRLKVLNPNDCIESTLKMLERGFDKAILVQRQLAGDIRPVEADATQLEQVILNIAVNARDAMKDGGIFTVQTRNQLLDVSAPYRPPVALPDGNYVVLGFRDTGCGMDAATIKRIFEPFFTTKGKGKGTGLGMSVVSSIVHGFGGEVRIESAPGKGTLFEIYLPASTKPMPVADVAAATEIRGGRECVLLAEDEEVIREMAQLSLESMGYKVLTAGDGAAALALYRQEWRRIHLVVADMVMPRVSGAELVAGMREINPNVRVIVSSGYSHDLEGQRMLERGCLGYLQKPYTATQLCQTIRTVLDSGL